MGALLALAVASAAPDLAGLWEARREFGPEARGELVLVQRGNTLVAEIAGLSAPVTVAGGRYTFELPGGKGAFRGTAGKASGEVRGVWIQPRSPFSGLPYASPVTLARVGDHWRGTVVPLDVAFTYYLPVTRAADGGFAAYLRNPERNLGVFTQVKRVEGDAQRVRLVGNVRGRDQQVTLFEGSYDGGRLHVPFANRGGMYEFTKVEHEASSAFYPRGKGASPYRYAVPPKRDDGWPTASLEEVGISRAAIEAFIQRIVDTPMASVHASQIHSVLIARHGKLVLEEYFHGHHRDRPHDTRSAAKSLVPVLLGAARHAGIRVGEETPVYETMLGVLPPDLDPRKRRMRLEHLLTMTGGHFCDDNNEEAPGNEDVMQNQQKEPDWYRYILALPMDREPGTKLVYCSVDAHLAGGVVAKAAGEPLPELFDRLVARPLAMGPYHMLLTPTGDGYMGGGSHFLPRDFLKLAQLMASGGEWQGRRIFGADWARSSGAALRDIMRGQKYGYLWNSTEYPYRGRTVRAIFAAGNGGQISLAIPELGLAIAFTGGNYGDPALFIPQRVLVPEQILPAVLDAAAPR